MIVVALVSCQKSEPRRAKHARAHAGIATAPAADQNAPSPAPVAAAPPVAPEPEPPPPPRRQLTVDRSVPAPPPAPRHIAAAPRHAAAPPPSPPAEPAAAYKAVNDKPSGTRCEGGSGKGERFAVQGVAANDVLNVREAPDKASAILGELPPDATGVHGTANRRRVGSSTWREVDCGNLHGWVNERFLSPAN
jgi:hypothetical protein